jgi:hypothetical protein
MFTLFQIMSRRGFTDAMMSTIGPRSGIPSQFYGFFFIAFNLLTNILVLLPLLSTFIRSISETTGQALLTNEQLSWSHLSNLLSQVRPAKRSSLSRARITRLLYRLAVRTTGTWHRTITYLLATHFLLLCLQLGPKYHNWDRIRGKYKLQSYVLITYTYSRLRTLLFLILVSREYLYPDHRT